jgi:hypothetical protein
VITYNNTLHAELQTSPAQYLLCNTHDDVIAPTVSGEALRNWREGHPRFAPFSLGQRVMRKVTFKGIRNVDKFANRFDGPYFIKTINSNELTYELQCCSDSSRIVRAHYRQLREWKVPPKYLADHPYYKVICEWLGSPHGEVRTDPVSPNFLEVQLKFDWETATDSTSSTESVVDSEEPLPEIEKSMTAMTLLSRSDDLVWCSYDSVGNVQKEPITDVFPGISELTSDAYAEPESFPTHAILSMCDETWSMSGISVDEPAHLHDLTGELAGVNVALMGDAVESVLVAADAALSHVSDFLEECVQIVDVSLSGVDHPVGALSKVDEMSSYLQSVKDKLQTDLTSLRRRSGRLAEASIASKLTSLRPHTRSVGPVDNLPNVQPKTLERRSK